MPTVLFDARLALPKPTGIGQYVVSLLPELLRAAPDWTFHVLRRPDPWPDYGITMWTAPNLVHHVTDERHMSLGQHWTLPSRARSLGADLLHYPHFDAPVLFGDIPVVSTIHGLMHVRPEGRRGLSLAKRLYARASYDLTIRRSARVLAVSGFVAHEIGERWGAADRTRATPLAADPGFRRTDETAVLAFRRDFSLERPFALFVGEFRPHKNVRGLLDAWQRARLRDSCDLVLAGLLHAGDDDPRVEIARRGLERSVRVLLDLPRAQLVAAYSACSTFVLVSRYEGFGLPVLEAMACGAPVITSAGTATAEVAGSAGVLVDPDSPEETAAALDRVLGSASERDRLADAGRARAGEYTWARTAALTLAAYRELVGARPA